MRKIFVACLSLFLFVACGAKKMKSSASSMALPSSAAVKDSSTEMNVEEYKNQSQKNEFQYQTLALEATADLDFPGLNKSVNLNLRLEKGEKIWASVTIFGFEVARALVTPDKIQILNKIQGEYIEKPFSFLNQYVGAIDFQTLQDMLIGNISNNFWNQNPTVQLNQGEATLIAPFESLLLQYKLNENVRPVNFDVKHQQNLGAMQVGYTNFSQTAPNLPTHVAINVQSEQTKIALILDYKSVQRNIQLDFPFKVPSKYATIN